ncbi:MAG: TIM barrel protein [Desulfosarcina sp.]|nr:TIM barrel protein [Desulfobacterales bacterium]
MDALIRCLKDMGAGGVELDYRIPSALFPQIKNALHHAGLMVGSLHNFCPIPPEFTRSGGGGDLFSLSATDRDERAAAVRWTLQTIEQANDLEARAVVLHCGRVAMTSEQDVLYDFFRSGRMDTDDARGFVARKLAERDRLKPPHLDALCFSLEKLLSAAERHHVRLGLENRYHYHELPGIDDFGLFFQEFEGAPLGYWHDTGHAHAGEALSLFTAGDLMKRYGSSLVGCHLHDARGLNDHLPPGTGQIDFPALKTFMTPQTLKVIELKPGTEPEDVRAGVRYLVTKELL